jgi:uncharacterized repeat protein (TIGR03803 family)
MKSPCPIKIACIALLSIATAAASHAQTVERISFEGTDGSGPYFVQLAQGRDGKLYGTTGTGGAYGYGTVFRATPQTGIETIHSFCALTNCVDGSSPDAGLVLGDDGNFYGTASQGGAANAGTVFRITPSGNFTTLYSFCSQPNCADGGGPSARLLQGIDGNFYGSTYTGGANASESLEQSYDDGGGTIFRITPNGALTTLYSFCALPNCLDGVSSLGGLIQASDGNFYGTTVYGGPPSFWCPSACGTIFKITPQGTLTTIYYFCRRAYCYDGDLPYAGLLQASDGNLYGTTLSGGAHGVYGSAFQLAPSGKLTTIHSFCYAAGCPDGVSPSAGLIQATDGNLYGTTGLYTFQGCEPTAGGGCGTIFSLTGSNLQTLFTFCIPNGKSSFGFNCPTGAGPLGGVMQATDGNFYGVTWLGGAFNKPDGDGTLFELSTGLGPFVSFVRAAGQAGQTIGILGQGFTGTTSVSLNGTSMSFTVVSDTFLEATVPSGATSGHVTVTTASGTLSSNTAFHVMP